MTPSFSGLDPLPSPPLPSLRCISFFASRFTEPHFFNSSHFIKAELPRFNPCTVSTFNAAWLPTLKWKTASNTPSSKTSAPTNTSFGTRYQIIPLNFIAEQIAIAVTFLLYIVILQKDNNKHQQRVVRLCLQAVDVVVATKQKSDAILEERSIGLGRVRVRGIKEQREKRLFPLPSVVKRKEAVPIE